MKIKLKSLAQKEKVAKMPHGESRAVESYPEVRISSSQLKGLDKAQIGKKYTLILEAECVSLRKPDDWDIQRGEGKNEILATLKLLKGAIEHEPENIAEAFGGMKEHKKEKES